MLRNTVNPLIMSNNNYVPVLLLLVLLVFFIYFIVQVITWAVNGEWLYVFFAVVLLPVLVLIYRWLKESNIL